jgi:protein TonB
MIKNFKTLLISVVVHIVVLVTTLYVWDNYVRVQKIEQDKKIELKLSEVLTTLEKSTKKPEIKTDKLVKHSEVKKIKPQKQKEQLTKVKKAEQNSKKIVKKYNLEPKKIEDFAVEQVPSELAFIAKKTNKKKTVKKVVKKITQKKKSSQIESAKTYLNLNTQKISKLLKDNLYYPRSARKRNITGEVTVRFKLGLNSRVYDIKVIKSNNALLSRAAMKTITDLSGKFPKPKTALILHVPIEYKLK